MKKAILTILFLSALVSAKAQIVATVNLTSSGKWYFVYEHTDARLVAPGVYNKVSQVKWEYRDTLTKAVVKTDLFTHTDTAFNTWWNGYNGFYALYLELAAKEGLPTGNQSAIEASFLNVAIPKPNIAGSHK